MKYDVVDFHISCDPSQLQIARDLLADATASAGLEAFEDTEDGMRGYVQEEQLDRELLAAMTVDVMPGVTVTYDVQPAENKDWNKTWEDEGFDPIDIEGKILVVDARRDGKGCQDNGVSEQGTGPLQDTEERAEDNVAQTGEVKPPLRIAIHAVNSFGTGTHETTQMILSMLLRLDVKDKCVLDCGCGTGILGIGASKLGAKEVVGYDIDEWCADNAKKNAELNGVTNMQVLLGDAHVLSHVCGIFDIVLANINRNILLDDMAAFVDVMARSGSLVLSGFYEQDIPVLLEKAASLNLEEAERCKNGDWCCLRLVFAGK